jgi:hypothetical protein
MELLAEGSADAAAAAKPATSSGDHHLVERRGSTFAKLPATPRSPQRMPGPRSHRDSTTDAQVEKPPPHSHAYERLYEQWESVARTENNLPPSPENQRVWRRDNRASILADTRSKARGGQQAAGAEFVVQSAVNASLRVVLAFLVAVVRTLCGITRCIVRSRCQLLCVCVGLAALAATLVAFALSAERLDLHTNAFTYSRSRSNPGRD